MMLAQIATSDSFTIKCAAIGGVVTLILNGIRQWSVDRAKLRRDDDQVSALHDIARLTNDVRLGQVAQNGKLATVVEVNKAYHEEVIRTLKECPHREIKQQTQGKQC
jgi:hypothetical protein